MRVFEMPNNTLLRSKCFWVCPVLMCIFCGTCQISPPNSYFIPAQLLASPTAHATLATDAIATLDICQTHGTDCCISYALRPFTAASMQKHPFEFHGPPNPAHRIRSLLQILKRHAMCSTAW